MVSLTNPIPQNKEKLKPTVIVNSAYEQRSELLSC